MIYIMRRGEEEENEEEEDQNTDNNSFCVHYTHTHHPYK